MYIGAEKGLNDPYILSVLVGTKQYKQSVCRDNLTQFIA
jgi:hypothetical protein